MSECDAKRKFQNVYISKCSLRSQRCTKYNFVHIFLEQKLHFSNSRILMSSVWDLFYLMKVYIKLVFAIRVKISSVFSQGSENNRVGYLGLITYCTMPLCTLYCIYVWANLMFWLSSSRLMWLKQFSVQTMRRRVKVTRLPSITVDFLWMEPNSTPVLIGQDHSLSNLGLDK